MPPLQPKEIGYGVVKKTGPHWFLAIREVDKMVFENSVHIKPQGGTVVYVSVRPNLPSQTTPSPRP